MDHVVLFDEDIGIGRSHFIHKGNSPAYSCPTVFVLVISLSLSYSEEEHSDSYTTIEEHGKGQSRLSSAVF